MIHKRNILITLIIWMMSTTLHAQVVIEDQGVSMTLEEMKQVIERWSPEMRSSAANDLGDRMELLNIAMVNKKIAVEADKMTPESDPSAYWKYYFNLQKMRAKFVYDQYMADLQVPDMSALAEERYQTEKDKYALVKEQRQSSHILFYAPPGFDRTAYRAQAAELLPELRAGANFEEMVAAHSTDPGTKDTGGKMERWMTYGENGITPHYTGALFDVEEVGGYSEVFETEFGVHIVRLDGIRESYYLPFEEVREQIIQSLESEYRALAAKEFMAGFRFGDDLRVDGELMEGIFSQYKTADMEKAGKE
jgi:peptidyl-prolyl cis-trans isomerase C